MAVARSSVFSAWRLQNAGWAMRRVFRSATDMLSASRGVFLPARNPSAARSPPTLRIRSAKTGSNSTQWPSPSITGWSRLERIWAGERWPFELMCLPPRTGGLWAEAYHRVSGCRLAGLSISRALVRPMGEDPFSREVPMPSVTQRVTPFLWFDSQAEEAAKFYTSVFPNSKIRATSRYDDATAKGA